MNAVRVALVFSLLAVAHSRPSDQETPQLQLSSQLKASARQLFTALRIEEPPPGSMMTEIVRVPSYSKVGPESTLIVRKSKSAAPAASPSSPVGIAVPPPVSITSAPLQMEEKDSPSPIRRGRKQARQLSHVDSDGIIVIEGIRVPDDEDDKRGKVWRNARVINNRLVPGKGIEFQSGNQGWVSSSGEQGNSDRARMLTFGNGNEPLNSAALIFDTPSAVTRREPITEAGVRTPVLQYAHPELGVQEARPAPLEDEEPLPDLSASSFGGRRGSTKDFGVHDDHSPFSFEPADADMSLKRSNDIDRERQHRERTMSRYASPQDNLAETEEENDDYYKYKGYRQGYGPYAGGKDHYRYKYATDQLPAQRPVRQPQRQYPSYESDRYERRPMDQSGGSYFPTRTQPEPLRPPASFPDLSLPAGIFEGLILDQGGAFGKSMWQRISDRIRTHVQSGVDRMSDFARPVMAPIVEATRKISHNLGFSNEEQTPEASEKVGAVVAATGGGIGHAFASPAVLLPALGIMAGGAALGLGAVAVGRFVDATSKSSVIYADVDDDIGAPLDDDARATGGKRSKRSTSYGERESDENYLERLEVRHEDVLNKLQQYGVDAWKETPCAKRIFCDVMTHQPEDTVTLMEKRMSTFLSLIHPSVAEGVSMHLSDVMSAVRSHDCSAFACSEQQMRLEQKTLRGGGGGEVDGSRVVAPAPGPGPR